MPYKRKMTQEEKDKMSQGHKDKGIQPSAEARSKSASMRNPRIESLNLPCVTVGCDRMQVRKNGLCNLCYQRKLKAKNPNRQKEWQLMSNYGIDYESFLVMLYTQDGICAVCPRTLDPPVVDHCHETGKVRQLLCLTCNTGLGMFRDNPSLLRCAADYLEKHGKVSDPDYQESSGEAF